MSELPPWEGLRVCVAGIGVSGTPAARTLMRLGAQVTAVDARDSDAERRRAEELRALGATVRLGGGDVLPDGAELVVTSPGWHPDAPLLAAAQSAGIPVIGEVELAWRVRPAAPGNEPGEQRYAASEPSAGPAHGERSASGRRSEQGHAAPWLALTGTNGKTTAVRMLAAMLTAAGCRTAAVGNVGAPLVEAVLADPPYDVLAVELSSFQLHWASSLRPRAGAVLNVAPDHLDWHGSLDAYAADKGRIFDERATNVFNADDAWSVRLATGYRDAVGFTLARPEPGQLGVAEGVLVDRAFGASHGEERSSYGGGVELAEAADVQPGAPHNIANALAAAALARSFGVSAPSVRAGLRAFTPEPHRIAPVASVCGVNYVDDSKATNPHAATASLATFDSVIWIAGGQLKGAEVDDLALRSASRIRAAVLLGADSGVIREALARHAPNVAVIEVSRTDTGAMETAVRDAASLARPGDTVLLAPAAASLDMFPSYAARGDAFAAAVRTLEGHPEWVG